MKNYIIKYQTLTDNHGNALLLRAIDIYEDGEGTFLWIELTHRNETSKICYEYITEENCWIYQDGDNEPSMPDSLLKLWHGSEGDKMLDYLLTTI